MAHRESSLHWSIRHDALRSGEAEQVLSEVANACRDICRAHLPRASGYELTCARLSGPLDGVTITVARANFRAMVSVQRFAAAVDAGVRLRLVAAAHHVGAEASSDARERTRALWGVSGCVAAMFGTGTIALYLMGLLATWGATLLVLPALVGTRMFFSMWLDGDVMRQRELPAARTRQAQHFALAKAETRDLSRWHKILRELEFQRDAVEERFALRPFRGLSPARANEASDAGLAIALIAQR